MALAMKYMYIVHRLVLTTLKQQDLHPGHRHYYRPRTKEEEQLSRRIQFTVKSPQTRVMSLKIYSQVARKAELYMSLQILSCSTTSSGILITHLLRLFRLNEDWRTRYSTHLSCLFHCSSRSKSEI